MKKVYVLTTMVLASLSVFASTSSVDSPISIDKPVNEGVVITVSVKSENGPVKDALIKVVSGSRTAITAGKTDESGNANITVDPYGGQIVTLEVFHSMYSTYKLKDIKLENNRTYNVSLRAKESTTEEINAESEANTEKIQGKIDEEVLTAEEAAKRKEEAIKRQEELQKETESINSAKEEIQKESEAAKQETEDIKKEAEELRANSSSMTEEKRKQLENDIRAREEAAAQRAAEAEERRKALEERAAQVELEKDKAAVDAAKKLAKRATNLTVEPGPWFVCFERMQQFGHARKYRLHLRPMHTDYG